MKPCKCGSTDQFVDSWYPPKGQGLEHFVRCRGCDETGPSCKDAEEAVTQWNEVPTK
jgi:hypothetical protein